MRRLMSWGVCSSQSKRVAFIIIHCIISEKVYGLIKTHLSCRLGLCMTVFFPATYPFTIVYRNIVAICHSSFKLHCVSLKTGFTGSSPMSHCLKSITTVFSTTMCRCVGEHRGNKPTSPTLSCHFCSIQTSHPSEQTLSACVDVT